ncbi:beta-adaptin [Friedmanniomyces endolithicus]|uniref:AP complex subunit beta n=1 Tax=Friedmanniomyces endolithicus TaxID=329885 RepID=A0AAN6H550_9PEZI|nr:beta-adaptin [Friedmanniomyces endolithicus]KAK0792038.1 beta-adaptin [Friedmanniomyces endolithicus]KAK0800699.1 beta-adaptin [Friedmanniomyces endolithicus]KAK0815770.1 beta-adaptin [Friedmanniomyces endolithicus]KAK0849734.1 beta-adaptin [Friedmanniomyces endolithicus]
MAVNRLRSALSAPRKGETYELRAGLVSQYAWERKESIQKTIMAMTLGKDVSALFPDVLKNIATPHLAQKKLVYLYLMNYAKTHPDLCILAVNTFVQDSEDPNPLVRAIAIRTMGCIRVDKMVDYMEEPLRKTLKDESPYVRKTAALCVAKLFDLNPALCIENGFLETLQEMIGDSNPMVVANSVTALAEITETAPETRALVVTSQTLKKLLLALNECTEWGRITILSTLADYRAQDTKEAEHVCERVSPQFQHVNPSVVLAAVKVVFIHMQHIENQQLHATYLKKMSPPLVTLISSQPEVQYVALRNIDLLLQKQPGILEKEMRVFFCKYNDPPYLKLTKLEIMVRIANSTNADQLLAELKEYAMEVDMDFVRRAVRAIGQVAIKIEESAEKAVNVLLELINTKIGYVVQEVIIVIKDIFRRYPGYEGIIPTLCQCIDELDEPNARGSLIWIVGEYAEKISNAGDILAGFVDGFNEEFTQTQLQILTAVVKLFLKKPDESQGLVQKVLQAATAESDNPDIRDRAYVYWRLLSSDPQVAKNIVLSARPQITSTIPVLSGPLLDSLIPNLSSLASVYQKPPQTFLGKGRSSALQAAAIEEAKQNARENPIAAAAVSAAVSGGSTQQMQNTAENLLDIDFDGAAPASMQKAPVGSASGLEGLAGTPNRVASPTGSSGAGGMEDLMGMFGNSNGALPNPMNGGGGSDDLMNGFASMNLNGGQPPPPQHQMDGGGEKKTKEDLLGLF